MNPRPSKYYKNVFKYPYLLQISFSILTSNYEKGIKKTKVKNIEVLTVSIPSRLICGGLAEPSG
jgi:hypothetical protein